MIGIDMLFGIISSLVASFFFWILSVYIPNYRKNKALKNSFLQHYKSFKEDTLILILGAVDGSANLELVRQLLNFQTFRNYFNGGRWDGFANELSNNEILRKDVLINLEILRNEVLYIQNFIEPTNKKIFEFLKNLSGHLIRLNKSDFETDDIKPFMQFLWTLFTAWDFIGGQHEQDIIESIFE